MPAESARPKGRLASAAKQIVLVVLVVIAVAAVSIAVCAPDEADDDGDSIGLAPTFPPSTKATTESTDPAPGAGTSPTTAPAPPSTTAAPLSTVGAAPIPDPGPGSPRAETRASASDRTGDLTPSPADRPPPWADLAGGTLIRRAEGFELRVRLGGDAAPTTTDADHTMNVASFYDVDGDGDIDYEVWANLAQRGWGSSYFNNREGGARYQDESDVAVAVEGLEVVLRFPLGHLDDAERFRWSLASEWGSYNVIGTAAAARDDCPDGDRPVPFPQ